MKTQAMAGVHPGEAGACRALEQLALLSCTAVLRPFSPRAGAAPTRRGSSPHSKSQVSLLASGGTVHTPPEWWRDAGPQRPVPASGHQARDAPARRCQAASRGIGHRAVSRPAQAPRGGAAGELVHSGGCCEMARPPAGRLALSWPTFLLLPFPSALSSVLWACHFCSPGKGQQGLQDVRRCGLT